MDPFLHRVTSVTDAKNNVTTFGNDRLGRSFRETKGTDARTKTLDAAGNVRQLTDRNGRVTGYEYDTLQRPTREAWKNGANQDIRELVYGYDVVGNLTTVADNHINPANGVRTQASNTMAFTYTTRDQLDLESHNHLLVGRNVIFDHDYDANDRETRLATTINGTISGSAVTGGLKDFANNYVYDGRSQWTSVSQTGQSGGHAVAPKLATFTHDIAGQTTDVRRYSSATVVPASLDVHSRFGYDGAGRQTNITHSKNEITAGQQWTGTSTLASSLTGGNLLAGYVTSFDAANRVTNWSSFADAFRTTYTYDVRDQVTGATHAAIVGLTLPRPVPTAESYNLDATGNRNTSAGVSQSAAGTHNRLQTDGTFNYTYDADGNITRRTRIVGGQVTDYTWDYRNRLTTITEKTSATGTVTERIEYSYDAFDNRTSRRLDRDGNGTWDEDEVWVWADGQEQMRLVDFDGQGAAQTFRVTNRYLWGEAVDQLLGDEQYSGAVGPAANATVALGTAGATLWALADHLGSVRDVIDTNSVVRQHVVYGSFGDRLTEQDYSPTGTPIAGNHAQAIDELFGYTGRSWDKEAELQYNRARWYDPATGRWLSQDPIGFAAGDANLYRYVGNQPTTKTDPSGLEELNAWIAENPNHPYAGAAQQLSNFENQRLQRLEQKRLLAWNKLINHASSMSLPTAMLLDVRDSGMQICGGSSGSFRIFFGPARIVLPQDRYENLFQTPKDRTDVTGRPGLMDVLTLYNEAFHAWMYLYGYSDDRIVQVMEAQKYPKLSAFSTAWTMYDGGLDMAEEAMSESLGQYLSTMKAGLPINDLSDFCAGPSHGDVGEKWHGYEGIDRPISGTLMQLLTQIVSEGRNRAGGR